MKEVQVSFNWAWPLFLKAMSPVLQGQSSRILGLSNDVKQISEFQLLCEKIAKKRQIFPSKARGAETKLAKCIFTE